MEELPRVSTGPSASGRAFGRYEPVQELGRGGIGVVHQAWRPDLQAFFAVPVLLAAGHADAPALARCLREAQATARLRHPIEGVPMTQEKTSARNGESVARNNDARTDGHLATVTVGTAIIVFVTVLVLPWEGTVHLILSVAVALVAGGLALWAYRWGSEGANRAVSGYFMGGFVGLVLAGCLLYHPFWSEGETRPQDAILAAVIQGMGAAGALLFWIARGRGRRPEQPPKP